MPRVKFLQDYGNYREGSEHEVADISALKAHIKAGRIEVLKATPEKAIAPTPEKAVINAPEVHTRTAKRSKKRK